MDELPRDFTKLFDMGMFKFDVDLIPLTIQVNMVFVMCCFCVIWCVLWCDILLCTKFGGHFCVVVYVFLR